MNNPQAFDPNTQALAAYELGGELKPFSFTRRQLRPDDVAIRIHYVGICHSDLHAIASQRSAFPLVPGHEIMGEVVAVGGQVTQFKPGDAALIGTIVDSCRHCEHCQQGMENYCDEFPTTTYGGKDRVDGSITYGGYSTSYVASERFVVKLPDGMDASRVAPLMCAGVTTYSPLKHWQAGPGKTVGVVGIGGLGHLAVKYARAMGAADQENRSADRYRFDQYADESLYDDREGGWHLLLTGRAATL